VPSPAHDCQLIECQQSIISSMYPDVLAVVLLDVLVL
jgi:hypothetical protein